MFTRITHGDLVAAATKKQGNTADNLKLPVESAKQSVLADTLYVLEPEVKRNVCDPCGTAL